MAGNRKHGFMRGNAAGRNGVGARQPFFCDACKKEHGRSVERTLFKEQMLCDRQYIKMKEAEFALQRAEREAATAGG